MSESGGQGTFTKDFSFNTITMPLLNMLLTLEGRSSVPDMNNDGKVDNLDINLYLRTRPAAELITAHVYSGMYPCGAVEDGVVIPDGGLIPAVKSGKYNKVPIILGGNKDEFKYFLPNQTIKRLGGFPIPDPYVPWLTGTWQDLWSVLSGIVPLDYVFNQNDKDLYQAMADFGSLDLQHYFVDNVARVLADQPGQKVYAYRFNWDGLDGMPNDYKFIMGAGHATEISFFFGFPGDIFKGLAFLPGQDTPGRIALSAAMMDYLANFAYTGNPNHWGLPWWQPWSNKAGKPKVIVFDAKEVSPEIGMTSHEITSAEIQIAYDKAANVANQVNAQVVVGGQDVPLDMSNFIWFPY
jgi:para-nitrobenzyl esterase